MKSYGVKMAFLALLLFCSRGFAYVAGATGLPAGSVELGLKLEWMRGLAGPESKPETQQVVEPRVNMTEVSVGYSLGEFSVFKDSKVRLAGTYYESASEILGGSTVYPSDDGFVVGVDLSANFIHAPTHIFGVFLRSQHPIDMDVAKFVNPKIDTVGLGIQSAFRFTDDFSQETLIFLGSGISSGGFKQNASLSAAILGVLTLREGIFSNGLAVRLGPFYDGDLGERSDAAYGTQGVRSFRLGIAASVTYSVTSTVVIDLNYTQKITGAYFRATKDTSAAVRIIL